MNPAEAGVHIDEASYAIGIVVAYEEIAKRLRQRAGSLFAQDQDALAKTYRGLAAGYEAEAQTKRKEWEKTLHQASRDAFEYLDGLEA